MRMLLVVAVSCLVMVLGCGQKAKEAAPVVKDTTVTVVKDTAVEKAVEAAKVADTAKKVKKAVAKVPEKAAVKK
jgi:hypothetical protein